MKPPTFSLLLLCPWLLTVNGDTGAGEGTWARFASLPYPEDNLFLHDTFPEGFIWSVGTSAYQTEGGWQQDGKGQSVWDTFTRKQLGGNGDEASDSYNNVEGDVAAIQTLGVTHYRFSIAWSRIFPDGLVSNRNEAGLSHYIHLIQRLRDIGVEPIVTLYHWDLPQALQDMYGGWINETLVDRFSEYAEFCFKAFGDRVKYWITIDNPYALAWHGYGTGKLAPGIQGAPNVPYIVAHNLIKAHSRTWHIYNDHFRQSQQGYVSIALASHWVGPKNGDINPETVQLCQCSINSVLGWFAKPIFIDGDYPECMKGNLKSLLPVFDDEEKTEITKTADFFALSFGPLSFRLLDSKLLFNQSKKYLLRQLLSWIQAEYNNSKILIVENGWDDSNGHAKTADVYNMYPLKKFLMDVLKAIKYDGVDVIGYTAWSLVDGFEWDAAYSSRRGLFYIDFQSKKKERMPKSSAIFYRQVIADKGFPPVPENKPITGTFPHSFVWGISEDVIQVESTPTTPQFVDRNIYQWDINGTGKLVKIKGVIGQSRKAQCTDYTTIRQEIQLLQNTHATHFQFSLNWSLLLPSGDSTQVNRANLRYYKCYVSELLRANVTPVIVLYHPTLDDQPLPSALGVNGGWMNPATVQAFVEYARFCFRQLGDKVKFWITMSEPNGIKYLEGYKTNFTIVGHNLIKAHALVWHLYNKEFRKAQNGQVSVSLHADWLDPADPFSRDDIEAAARTLEFDIGWFAEPIFGNGDYPYIIRDWQSQRQNIGWRNSYLPHFTNEEKELIRGSVDFVALNHYTTHIVHLERNTEAQDGFELKVQHLKDTTWLASPDGKAVVPWGLRKLLRWIKSKYGNIPIYITSNGIDDDSPSKDKLRVYYIQSYINEALKALKLDGVNIRGYFAWALKDIDEPNYGLYNSNQAAKLSVEYYRRIVDNGGFPATKSPSTKCYQGLYSSAECNPFYLRKQLLIFTFCTLSVFTATMFLVIYYSSKRCRKYK
ncbi:klotho isoform X2 [Pristis pectinata]|uniref:klotho isoform X2 n=1 Tax=Pristis pectinata TaxID=685728 RepID=UPI00223E34B9|nr:klotho isoform X2 [Pristis pectinata]